MGTTTAVAGRPPSFWSCFTHQRRDPLALAYRDELGEAYAYDSNVRNFRQVAVGDVLVVRDNHLVYGRGVVESITKRPGTKQMRRCPQCGSASKVSEQKTSLPRFRCRKCGHQFDQPRYGIEPVTEFVAHYGHTWIEFVAHAPVSDLERLFANPARQNAIRPLVPAATAEFIDLHLGLTPELDIEYEPGDWERHGGHTETRVRTRRFQEQFRRRLLTRYGETCAVTGRHPAEVLDAAHLYPYAQRHTHREREGLLLRKDVHRLFDAMLLTVDAASLTSVVAPPMLRAYPALRSLHSRPLGVPPGTAPDLDLLARHHALSKERWKGLPRELDARPQGAVS